MAGNRTDNSLLGLTYCVFYATKIKNILASNIYDKKREGRFQESMSLCHCKILVQEKEVSIIPGICRAICSHSRKCARRSKRNSAVATLDQVVLKSMTDQEAGSDTVARRTSGSETSVGPCTREFCNQCLLCRQDS